MNAYLKELSLECFPRHAQIVVPKWRLVCKEALDSVSQQQYRAPRLPESQIQCHLCRRLFRREAGLDLARHKCIEERKLPVCQQRGAAQCLTCNRWFRSRGGLAVHRCAPLQPSHASHSSSASGRSRNRQASTMVAGRGPRSTDQATQTRERNIQCQQCSRCFSRPGDVARHKCIAERSKPVQEQRGATQCPRR